MEGSAERKRLLLVDADALPEVFARVVDAKRFLATGEAATAAEASAPGWDIPQRVYKYKDAVFPYDEKRSGRILTVHMVLRDRPGVLSAVLSAFADAGANILTVNQNIPAGNVASVSVSARTDRLQMPGGCLYRRTAAAQRCAADCPHCRRRSAGSRHTGDVPRISKE